MQMSEQSKHKKDNISIKTREQWSYSKVVGPALGLLSKEALKHSAYQGNSPDLHTVQYLA